MHPTGNQPQHRSCWKKKKRVFSSAMGSCCCWSGVFSSSFSMSVPVSALLSPRDMLRQTFINDEEKKKKTAPMAVSTLNGRGGHCDEEETDRWSHLVSSCASPRSVFPSASMNFAQPKNGKDGEMKVLSSLMTEKEKKKKRKSPGRVVCAARGLAYTGAT